MKSIKAEGLNFKYLFANEVIDEMDVLLRRDIPLNIYKELQGGVNTRFVFFKRRVPPKNPISPEEARSLEWAWVDSPYCLVWPNDKIDLNMLDQKVMDNCFSDQDFYDSIITRIIKLICFNCRNKYITLVADPYDIYIGEDENGNIDRFQTDFDLLKHKFSNLKSERCPNCNHPFTMHAIKILYQYTEGC